MTQVYRQEMNVGVSMRWAQYGYPGWTMPRCLQRRGPKEEGEVDWGVNRDTIKKDESDNSIWVTAVIGRGARG
jgi:hypothetical protein